VREGRWLYKIRCSKIEEFELLGSACSGLSPTVHVASATTASPVAHISNTTYIVHRSWAFSNTLFRDLGIHTAQLIFYAMSIASVGFWSTASRLSRSCRTFSTSVRRSDFHFDTHHFVQRLEREGLNRAQAEGIMSAMAEVIDESIRNMTSNMVTKAEQEKVCTRMQSWFMS